MIWTFPQRTLLGVGYRAVTVQITVPLAIGLVREVAKNIIMEALIPLLVIAFAGQL